MSASGGTAEGGTTVIDDDAFPASDHQHRYMFWLLHRLGIVTRTERLTTTAYIIGRPIASGAEFCRTDARVMIHTLKKWVKDANTPQPDDQSDVREVQ
jgi:hypothetical protein